MGLGRRQRGPHILVTSLQFDIVQINMGMSIYIRLFQEMLQCGKTHEVRAREDTFGWQE